LVLAQKHKLSPYYVHRAEAQLAAIRREPDRAFEHAEKAADLGPGTKAWYNLAYAHIYKNRPKAGRDALLKLDPDKEPMKGWYSYHSMLARVHHELGDYDAEMAVAQDALKRYPDSRSPMLITSRNLAATGQLEALEEVFQKAEEMPPAGAGTSTGAIMVTAAAELTVHGKPDLGKEMYGRAVDWYATAGDAVSSPTHQTWNTLALIGANRWDDAMAVCDRQLEAQPEYQWYHEG
jgi:tetratricopeptide (TPR) repeat protein